jgi:hypothetical protein
VPTAEELIGTPEKREREKSKKDLPAVDAKTGDKLPAKTKPKKEPPVDVNKKDAIEAAKKAKLESKKTETPTTATATATTTTATPAKAEVKEAKVTKGQRRSLLDPPGSKVCIMIVIYSICCVFT